MLQRIERLLEQIPNESAVFVSSKANVFYYSGFTSEDAYLLISENKRIIITDSRYFIQAQLEAPEFDLVDISKGWKNVFSAIKERLICFEEENISYSLFKTVQGAAPDCYFRCSQKSIDFPRRLKDRDELAIIAEAEKIGDMAFSHILTFIKPGISERDIALELETYMKRQGASDLSFATIAASGVRSAMPHGTASAKIVQSGELLTLDFGCVYKGYCSDMTRTVMIGPPDSKQKEIYEIVLKAQTKAINGLYEGISCFEADKIARDVIVEAGYGKNFSHSLGHSVGIQVHERPVFSPKSEDFLQNGNVMSVEPGIYIEGWGGVRIEDLIAVFDGQIINLSKSTKELIVI